MRTLKSRKNFIDFVNTCNLRDFGNIGPVFAWINKREFKDLAKARLHKCHANECWLKITSDSTILSQPILYSDHSTLILDTCPSPEKGKSYIKTKPFWFSQASCLKFMENSWTSFNIKEQNGDIVLFLQHLKPILP